MQLPNLIVVSGPPGSGKTTLAHELSRAIGCPAICRDEIKEGMVHAHGAFDRDIGDELTHATFPLFFDVLELLLKGQVTVIAEAAFQDRLWRQPLERLAPLADVRIIHCVLDGPTAYARRIERAERSSLHSIHMDAASIRSDSQATQRHDAFVYPVLPGAPSLQVVTSDGYDPSLEEVVAFASA